MFITPRAMNKTNYKILYVPEKQGIVLATCMLTFKAYLHGYLCIYLLILPTIKQVKEDF